MCVAMCKYLFGNKNCLELKCIRHVLHSSVTLPIFQCSFCDSFSKCWDQFKYG